jgi:hypothetical protein
MGRKAPRKRLACRVMCTPNGCFARTRTFLGAPPTPRFGLVKQRFKAPGVKNAPREREWLFDIVRWELPKTVRRRAVTSVVVILRSAHAEEIPRIRARRTRVSKDEGEGRRILAKRTQRAFWPNEAKRGACARAKDQPAAVRNDRRRNFIVFGLLFTMKFATHTCRPD